MNDPKTKTITIRFYEELNDFLGPERRRLRFQHNFINNPSIKDIIESLGVPHTEIDLILANGNSINFNYQPKNSDDISVYPVFEKLDITELTHLRPKPLRDTKFILDVHLGKLARQLRMLGFDCSYRNDFPDDEIVALAAFEKRIILTRDVNLLKHKKATHGHWVRHTDPHQQLLEIIRVFQLEKQLHPFKRCMDCNGLITEVSKDQIQDQLPPKTKQYYEQFYQCQDCKKVYWEGSHYDKMQQLIDSLGN